jgi:hypothetical protein
LKGSRDEWFHLTSHIEAFESAVSHQFKKDFVKAAFAFQFPPIEPGLSNLAIHAIPHQSALVKISQSHAANTWQLCSNRLMANPQMRDSIVA